MLSGSGAEHPFLTLVTSAVSGGSGVGSDAVRQAGAKAGMWVLRGATSSGTGSGAAAAGSGSSWTAGATKLAGAASAALLSRPECPALARLACEVTGALARVGAPAVGALQQAGVLAQLAGAVASSGVCAQPKACSVSRHACVNLLGCEDAAAALAAGGCNRCIDGLVSCLLLAAVRQQHEEGEVRGELVPAAETQPVVGVPSAAVSFAGHLDRVQQRPWGKDAVGKLMASFGCPDGGSVRASEWIGGV